MNSRTFGLAATALTALSISTMADARSMRAVGSSTVYPFAKAVAERVARANPALGTPVRLSYVPMNCAPENVLAATPVPERL